MQSNITHLKRFKLIAKSLSSLYVKQCAKKMQDDEKKGILKASTIYNYIKKLRVFDQIEIYESNSQLLKFLKNFFANISKDQRLQGFKPVFIYLYKRILKRYDNFKKIEVEIENILRYKSEQRLAIKRLGGYTELQFNILQKEAKQLSDNFCFIFFIYAYNGIRLSEWENINFRQLLEHGETIIGTLKHNNKRYVRMPQFTNKAEAEHFRQILKTNLTYFQKLSAEQIGDKFKMFSRKIKKQYGDIFVNKTISTHVLRHHVITNWAQEGASSSEIKGLSGHKNTTILESTYINLSPNKVKTIWNKFSKPFADINVQFNKFIETAYGINLNVDKHMQTQTNYHSQESTNEIFTTNNKDLQIIKNLLFKIYELLTKKDFFES
ncbi:site-specific integrase [Mycoplasmopsis columbinasalis]|uniref:Phage integrase family n=1 Tax=Mycoplasmopsis columbinasalis TaxID=114880 RepID=A0A449BB05_9BACT|nr:site-specific integrase [Mycoplasmopsis columbinasalis]VEU78364.1 Phage integrase family [Mycoplasmopsis columbinasalis]